jgi:hypothetical protein
MKQYNNNNIFFFFFQNKRGGGLRVIWTCLACVGVVTGRIIAGMPRGPKDRILPGFPGIAKNGGNGPYWAYIGIKSIKN